MLVASVNLLVPYDGLCHFSLAIEVADFDLPPQDSDGWTVLSPSDDSQIVYVHATDGNDLTGVVYIAGDEVIGDDPFLPDGEVMAFATITAAKAHLRKGWPDWLLLARGETWQESSDLGGRPRGRSSSERLVAAAYGPLSQPRPILQTRNNQRAINHNQLSNIAIMSLSFHAYTRDPLSSDYAGIEASLKGVMDSGFIPVIPVMNDKCETFSLKTVNLLPTATIVLPAIILQGRLRLNDLPFAAATS